MKAIIDKVKSYPKLKKLTHRMLIPRNQARPRLWVKLFVNPFLHKKGNRSTIRKRVRIDTLPYNQFVIGEDTIIEDFSTVNNGVGDVIIGDRTIIGMSNVLIGPVKIGNDIMFAQNVVLSGLNHGYEDITTSPSKQNINTKEIIIEDEVWIGANSVVVPGVTIGKHSIVAAGSVVTKDVQPYSIVAGNPARLVKKYNFNTNEWERIRNAA